MIKATENISVPAFLATASVEETKRDYEAYTILHWGFVALPLIAGIDKFLGILCAWEKYLAPQIGQFLGANMTMRIVGAIEIVAAIGVALKPRFFAPIVALWLAGIIVNLLLIGGYYDVALRDFGLALGAMGLWRLSQHFDKEQAQS